MFGDLKHAGQRPEHFQDRKIVEEEKKSKAAMIFFTIFTSNYAALPVMSEIRPYCVWV
jgi:hypothetical protein